MSINARVREIIDSLYGGNKRAFSRAIGIAATVTENIVGKRGTYPSYEVTYKITQAIENINVEWLITGKGEMFNVPVGSDNGKRLVADKDSAIYINKSFIDQKPYLEKVLFVKNGFTQTIRKEQHIHLTFPYITDYDFSIRYSGNSILKKENPEYSIKDGDFVACKIWKDLSNIRPEEVYAVLTPEGHKVGKLISSGNKDDHFILTDVNEENTDPEKIVLSEILDLAVVKGVATFTSWDK